MDIKEKAKEYAEGKATAALEQAIADAYADGYQDGYTEGVKNVPLQPKNTDPNFVDLGLPSGTLWAVDFLRDEEDEIIYLSYREAMNYKLPLRKQWKEIFDSCKCEQTKDGLTFTANNGEKLYVSAEGYMKDDILLGYYVAFWFRDGYNPTLSQAECAQSIELRGQQSTVANRTNFLNIKCKLPVLIVKKK